MKPLEQQLIEDGKRAASRISPPEGFADSIGNQLSDAPISSSTPKVLWALAASLVLGVAVIVFSTTTPPDVDSQNLSVDLSQVTDPERLLVQELGHIEDDLQSLQQQVSEELSFLL